MISRTEACLKVLAAKLVELQKVRRTRLFGRSIFWIDYGGFEVWIAYVLRVRRVGGRGCAFVVSGKLTDHGRSGQLC
jgi:hypothetical protein